MYQQKLSYIWWPFIGLELSNMTNFICKSFITSTTYILTRWSLLELNFAFYYKLMIDYAFNFISSIFYIVY